MFHILNGAHHSLPASCNTPHFYQSGGPCLAVVFWASRGPARHPRHSRYTFVTDPTFPLLSCPCPTLPGLHPPSSDILYILLGSQFSSIKSPNLPLPSPAPAALLATHLSSTIEVYAISPMSGPILTIPWTPGCFSVIPVHKRPLLYSPVPILALLALLPP